MTQLVQIVPLFPLIGFLIITWQKNSMSKKLAATIASASVFISFAISVMLFTSLVGQEGKASATYDIFTWMNAGSLKISMSFLIDPLSSLFLLIITGIGFLIHVYSAGYMHDDEHHNKFFSYLNLFIFFMLLLVLGSNYLVMFVGWEGVGLCSYLLIGFWFKNINYSSAAKKAFIMNRIGDLGFLLGIILIYITFDGIDYATVFEGARNLPSNQGSIVAITMLLFIGAMGKSAQLPLYTWLPDAMAGPTPVSALIHAATMVTAGIYMIARSNILYALAPETMHFVALIGIITAVVAATIGLVQNDIKKVLAYSTVSQLGLMFLGLGVGAFSSAVFHVMTHAFFKACLFLGAGSVIHAMHHEQDIRKMGGLKKHLPITHLTFLLSTLAIAGIPPFSGFFSKDEIFAHTFEHDKVMWLFGVLVAVFTAFYMFRLYYLTFHGDFRGTKHQLEHLHESPSSMTTPLVVLAVLATLGGLIGIPGKNHLLQHFLEPVFADAEMKLLPIEPDFNTELSLMAVAVVTAVISILVARNKYVIQKEVPAAEGSKLTSMHNLVYHKYFIDELYENIITKPLNWLSQISNVFVEKEIIDGSVTLVKGTVDGSSGLLKNLQTGKTGFYILCMVIGIIAILATLMF